MQVMEGIERRDKKEAIEKKELKRGDKKAIDTEATDKKHRI